MQDWGVPPYHLYHLYLAVTMKDWGVPPCHLYLHLLWQMMSWPANRGEVPTMASSNRQRECCMPYLHKQPAKKKKVQDHGWHHV
jgi:hypothetical protein